LPDIDSRNIGDVKSANAPAGVHQPQETGARHIAGRSTLWLTALRWYLPFVVAANLVWEFAQLPLYTIWWKAPAGHIVFAALHCTGGDALIATMTLVLALLFMGGGWPEQRSAFRRVAVLTVAMGVGYTMFSEWLNVEVQEAWAYSEAMPMIPVVELGLSPVLQWLVIPLAGFALVRRTLRARRRTVPDASAPSANPPGMRLQAGPTRPAAGRRIGFISGDAARRGPDPPAPRRAS